MLMVGTYWDRLSGFSNVLMNPKAWSIFGYGRAEDGTGMYQLGQMMTRVQSMYVYHVVYKLLQVRFAVGWCLFLW